MSNGNLCIIKLKPFWLSQLPVTLEQALSYKKKKASVIFVIQTTNLISSYYLPKFPEYWYFL